MAFPSFSEFLKKRSVAEPSPQKPAELPKIDSKDAIGSLVGILGPSPEERAAEEQRLQAHRKKMHGWTALFNGLRHLGNLYYTAKGAAPQTFNDPHAEIEQQYQAERKRLADTNANNQKYYTNLWGLYRQMNDEQRKDMLAEARRDYYGIRDDAARQKAYRDRYDYRTLSNGKVLKIDKEEGTATEISESDPLYVEYMRSRTNRNNRAGTGSGGRRNGTYGYKTTKHVDPATGDVITERVPTTGNQPQGKENTTKTVTPANRSAAAKGKYDKYKKGKGTAAAKGKWGKYKTNK